MTRPTCYGLIYLLIAVAAFVCDGVSLWDHLTGWAIAFSILGPLATISSLACFLGGNEPR